MFDHRTLFGMRSMCANPLADVFHDILQEKRSGFVGRERFFEDVEAWSASEDAGGSRALLVIGAPGAGKSAFLGELALGDHPTKSRVIAVHVCVAHRASTLDPIAFARSIVLGFIGLSACAASAAEALATLGGQTGVGADPICILQCLFHATQGADVESGRLLLVDSLDESQFRRGRSIADILAELLPVLPPWLRVIATVRTSDRILDSFTSVSEVWPIDENAQAHVAIFLEKVVPGSALASQAGANFLLARYLAEAFRVGQSVSGVAGLDGLYAALFARDVGDEFVRVRPFLAILLTAGEPLNAVELEQAVVGTHPSLGGEKATRALAALGRFLAPGKDFAFCHESLLEWLIDPRRAAAGGYYISLERGHLTLAAWYVRRIALAVQGDFDQLLELLLQDTASDEDPELQALLEVELEMEHSDDEEDSSDSSSSSGTPHSVHAPMLFRAAFHASRAPAGMHGIFQPIHNLVQEEGGKAVRIAAQEGEAEAIRILAKSGADLETKVSGTCALHSAALAGHASVVQALLELRASLHSEDLIGCTAIHYAAMGGNGNMIRLLASAGARVDALNNFGSSPAHYVDQSGSAEARRVLDDLCSLSVGNYD